MEGYFQTFNMVHGGQLKIDNTSVMSFVFFLEAVEDEPVAEVHLDAFLAPPGDVQTLHRLSLLLPDQHRVRIHSNKRRRWKRFQLSEEAYRTNARCCVRF